MAMETIRYDPPLWEHPSYVPTPEFGVGDAVEVLAYSGVRVLRDDEGDVMGAERYLSDSFLEKQDAPYVQNSYIVKEIDGVRVKVQFGLNGDEEWIPHDRIVGVDDEKRKELEERQQKRREYVQRVQERKETDMDVLMEEVVKPHARKVVDDVWPGGTVDVDEIAWAWNPWLTDSAGMAYYRSAVPERVFGKGVNLAIALAPDYYYQHGIDDLLEIVRHELIHIWQYKHPNGKSRGGHGPDFKQWMDDLDTHRHCNHWSKQSD